MTINERISALRTLMLEKGIDAYIIPSEDPHGSEYVTPHWQSRKWISGFTGSAGSVVVTREMAGLWTDFRYYIQAEGELKDSEIKLFRMGMDGVPDYDSYLAENLDPGQIVGIDGRNFSVTAAEKLKKLLEKSKVALNTDCELVDEIWTENRPPLPSGKVFIHPIKYNGLSRKDKLEKLRSAMGEMKASHHILSSLEDICWLYNIRGRDLDCIPVVISFTLITREKSYLYVDLNKIDDDVKSALEKVSVEICPYNKIREHLSQIGPGSSVLVDRDKISISLVNAINDDGEVVYGSNPTMLFKSTKNATEIDNIREAMEQDGVAMVRFLKWLEENRSETQHSELSLAARLKSFREMGSDFAGESFTPIPGYRAHGAMCHYSADEENQYTVDDEGGLFLIDSGGQYPGGTTDITRTTTLGNPTDREIRDYTLVLKGHVALSLAQFPAGTRGYQLDLLARMAMWKEGIDYGHGTGHGVGHYLSVHEGPLNISPKPINVALQPGMVISNEPGIYREGKYGIRIENLVLVREERVTEFGKFYNFETLTLCPYEPRLIDISLLEEREIRWINEYNKMVFDRLSPLLNNNEVSWLKAKTIELD